jgi:hypothetical protein
MDADHRLDRRGVTLGLVAVGMVVVITFVGSEQLTWFDPALVGYLFGTVFAVFGVTYRYTVWLRRPPTAMLNRRGWEAFRTRKAANAAALPSLVATQLVGQRFIHRRSRSRWLAHQLVFWGCILAALVTFPLTLGLLHFESVGQDASEYQVFISRVGTASFDAESVLGSTSRRSWCSAASSSSCGDGSTTRARSPSSAAATSSPWPACSRCR